MQDTPLDQLSPIDGYVTGRQVCYAALYPTLRAAARKLGWALAVHGSLIKDLDVIAIPWVEGAAPERELVGALVEASGGYLNASTRDIDKPHGRRAYAIMLGITGGYVDLSVVQRQPTGPPSSTS